MRVTAGNAKDRYGNPLTIKVHGPVEPYFRDKTDPDIFVIAERSDEAIQLLSCAAAGLLRFARNDGWQFDPPESQPMPSASSTSAR